MAPIPPLSNPRSDRVKAVRGLARRSARLRTGLFLAEGPQSVREAVRCRPDLVRDLYVTEAAAARHTGVVEDALAAGLFVHACTDEVLAAMGDTDAPQGMLAVCRWETASLADVLAASPRLLLVLTHVRDPGNAGTVIRGADAAGADAVIVSDNSVDAFSPKVVRSTAGSLFHLPIVTGMPVPEILAALAAARITTLAADGAGGTLLHDAPLAESHAWVMGNEAWGLPEDIRDACDDVVRVPIYGRAESLNLAMAATVCLYESARVQRTGPPSTSPQK